MSAFHSNLGENGASREFMRVAIAAGRPALRERLALLLDAATPRSAEIIYRGDLAAFFASGRASSVDVAVIGVEEAPGEAVKAQIDALTRATGVALVGDPLLVRALTPADGMRARICLSRDDLTSASLAAALTGLLRARASENRLLRVVADQNGQAQQMRSAGARLAHEAGFVVRTLDALALEIGDCAMTGAAKRAIALAMDAAQGLEGACAEFEQPMNGLVGRQSLLGAADLSDEIDAFVGALSGAGARNVSALSSSGPIFVQADGVSLRRLLDRLLKSWRAARRPTDRLELLSWDAGAEAKLAIVISAEAFDFAGGLSDAAGAPAGEFLGRLRRDLKPYAEACGARIDAAGRLPAATTRYLTLSLPKKPRTPAYPLLDAASALAETLVAQL